MRQRGGKNVSEAVADKRRDQCRKLTEVPARAHWRTQRRTPDTNEWAKTDHLATATNMPKTNLWRLFYADLAPKKCCAAMGIPQKT